MQHTAVQAAQAHQQYCQSPGNHQLQAGALLWLQRLQCVSQRLRVMQQQLEEVRAMDQVDKQQVEMQVSQATVAAQHPQQPPQQNEGQAGQL